MVSTAKRGTPPPDELKTAWDCQRWKALPEAGGTYDQDAKLMHRMAIFLNVYNAVSRLYNLKGEMVHNLTNNEMKIIRMLKDSGMLYG